MKRIFFLICLSSLLTPVSYTHLDVYKRQIRNIVLMRPVNSMIEFKQIVGRGTRLFDGKDFFTIYDFVDAYHHFSDPEWDGDALPCEVCGQLVCECQTGPKPPPQPCAVCGPVSYTHLDVYKRQSYSLETISNKMEFKMG